jgi:hypothetical protein
MSNGPFQQTNFPLAFNQSFSQQAANSAKALTGIYLSARQFYLGIPKGQQQQQAAQGQQRQQPTSPLTCAQRLAARGTNVVADLTQAQALNTYITTTVNAAITALGGVSAIVAADIWGWVLPFCTSGAFVLPSLPFTWIRPTDGLVITVNVIPDSNGDGGATVSFTDPNGNPVSPAPF